MMTASTSSGTEQDDETVGAVELDLGADVVDAAIRLPARSSGVAVARQFVVGMGNALHLDVHACEDLKLATTEACTNAVVHAYPNGSAGPMEVAVRPGEGDDLVVVVRDAGMGLPDGDPLNGDRHGYGLSLIEAVSDELALGRCDGGGTEVTMRFRHARETPEQPIDAIHSPVLRRVIAMMAADAGFSMDRLSDAVLVAETLAAHTPVFSADSVVHVVVEDRRDAVALRVGPLVAGGAADLLDASRVPAYGRVLEHLADGIDTTSDERGEYLHVELRRRG